MSNTAQQAAVMIDMLPNDEQLFALEFIKRLVLAWDPDYTKVTMEEAEALSRAEEDFAYGEFVREDEIDWKDTADISAII